MPNEDLLQKGFLISLQQTTAFSREQPNSTVKNGHVKIKSLGIIKFILQDD